MSLPSQQRRGAASGRARSRVITKRRRRQGVPTPLKAAAAIAMLAIVFWIGWAVLGSNTPIAQDGKNSTLQQASNTPKTESSVENLAASDPALDAILNDSTALAQPNPSLLAAAIDKQDPVRDSALPEPAGSTPVVNERTASHTRTTRESTPTRPLGSEQAPAASTGLAGAAKAMLDADMLGSQGRFVEARTLLNASLLASTTSQADRAKLRQRLGAINEKLIFGPTVDPADPMTEVYKVQPGDTLARIANRRELATHYKLIARVNGIKDPSKIRIGQSLKLVRGPFHAVIDKSEYRLDVYHGAPDSPGSWVYITSMPIGLGERDGTPTGSFVVSANKLENPGWVNPRNSAERYDRNDPKNPIGDYWIGIDGIGPSAVHVGFGLHGTIDPDSIGSSRSMGCVRLGDEDIAKAFELLEEQVSVVHIVE